MFCFCAEIKIQMSRNFSKVVGKYLISICYGSISPECVENVKYEILSMYTHCHYMSDAWNNTVNTWNWHGKLATRMYHFSYTF